jgi:ubiquinone/menaquinone biosynthesis C-methylase UbiE
LSNNQNYKLLSIGSGTGFYEREFAKQNCFSEIVGIELSEDRVKEAEQEASENNFNIKYLNQNFYDIDFKNKNFDIILFNASLHHFENIEIFLSKYIKPLLNQNGFLIICEYVGKNRIYIPNFQLNEVNKLLKMLSKKYKKYAGISNYKKKAYSPGLIRMKLNDPSEAIDSEAILPTLHKYFRVLEEKQLCCNLLMPLMRGIAYNFIDKDNETIQILQALIEADTNFTKQYNISDFIFGIYQ